MPSVVANGITIEYEAQGDGEPLLLVMGLGGQLTDWPVDFVDMLVAGGFRVIRYDNRDAGLSTELGAEPLTTGQLAWAALAPRRAPVEYRIGDMAADGAGLLEALGIARAHVVGQSLGGMIAQAMVIEHPSRVRSLTSIMATTGRRRYALPRLSVLRSAARLSQTTTDEAVEAGIEMMRAISGPGFDEREAREMAQVSLARSFRPDGVGRQMAAVVASPDRTAGLRRVTAPTLVIHGLLDPLVRPAGGVATARAVPGSRLLMFNDMGHDLPKARRREIADEIAVNASRPSPAPAGS